MAHVFGPVLSRRLGLSLGVDLLPPKTCSYDCLYCQIGRTTDHLILPTPLVPVGEVILELRRRLEVTSPDVITFSGSGEPTLHSEIDQVIAFVKAVTKTPVAVLTNGSLLWKEEVRKRILSADMIMPTLSTVFEETFRIIHRPDPSLKLSQVIEGIRRLREEFRGRLFLEVVLLAGMNDQDREIQGLKEVIDQIAPDRIQLNTVVRPPADRRALSLDRKRLEEIKNFFGPKSEIIAEMNPARKEGRHDSLSNAVIETAKRRPLRVQDVVRGWGVPLEEAEATIKKLVINGVLHPEEHSGEVFYTCEASESRDDVE